MQHPHPDKRQDIKSKRRIKIMPHLGRKPEFHHSSIDAYIDGYVEGYDDAKQKGDQRCKS